MCYMMASIFIYKKRFYVHKKLSKIPTSSMRESKIGILFKWTKGKKRERFFGILILNHWAYLIGILKHSKTSNSCKYCLEVSVKLKFLLHLFENGVNWNLECNLQIILFHLRYFISNVIVSCHCTGFSYCSHTRH